MPTWFDALMLRAEKTSIWGREYAITVDGSPVSTFSPHWWKSGGTVGLDGREYRIGSNLWGGKYAMTDAEERLVAAAEKVGRKHWTVEADGRSYQFRKASFWSSDQQLVQGDQEVGLIRKASMWSNTAEADLPGLSLPVQVFVVAVVLTMWEQASSAAATSAST